jgi:processive 1,2-diacylglycerol beta-glucosyltransferase
VRIGLLYVAAGHGHKKAAEALKEALLLKSTSIEIELQDVTSFGSKFIQKTYIPSYDLLAVHYPKIWGFFFHLSNSRMFQPLVKIVRRTFNALHLRGFVQWVSTKPCDVYISTHFMPAEVLGHLKQKGRIQSKLVTMVTDFRVHQLWINGGTDYYLTMTEDAKSDIMQYGVDPKTIQVCGIPIASKFSRTFSQLDIRKKLNLKENLFTVLITTGSFGSGPLSEILEELDKATGVQSIIVCAQNKILFNNLQYKTFKNPVTILGYVSNMEELMAASDVIIAKPGGLTCCEALAQNLILILTSPIPGQEEGNREYLLRHGCAFSLDQPAELSHLLEKIKQPQQLTPMKEAILKIRKPNASQEIATWILTLQN